MDWTDPITVAEMYGEWAVDEETVRDILDRSRNPRSSSSLYDTVGETGLGPDQVLLDIGARDARHSIALVERYGCRAVAIDPVDKHLEAARAAVAGHEHRDRIEIRRGSIENIPAASGEFDVVLCRDMFNHIQHPAPALAECFRVLDDGGHMVVYQTFATARLEPAEAVALYADLAIVPQRMSPEDFERRVLDAGFSIQGVDPVGSEWREAWEEDGNGRTARSLLHVARLLRVRDEMLAELGEVAYRVELSDALWGVYQMIGKLEPRIYVLGRPIPDR